MHKMLILWGTSSCPTIRLGLHKIKEVLCNLREDCQEVCQGKSKASLDKHQQQPNVKLNRRAARPLNCTA